MTPHFICFQRVKIFHSGTFFALDQMGRLPGTACSKETGSLGLRQKGIFLIKGVTNGRDFDHHQLDYHHLCGLFHRKEKKEATGEKKICGRTLAQGSMIESSRRTYDGGRLYFLIFASSVLRSIPRISAVRLRFPFWAFKTRSM